jgi:hypothetical protein
VFVLSEEIEFDDGQVSEGIEGIVIDENVEAAANHSLTITWGLQE